MRNTAAAAVTLACLLAGCSSDKGGDETACRDFDTAVRDLIDTTGDPNAAESAVRDLETVARDAAETADTQAISGAMNDVAGSIALADGVAFTEATIGQVFDNTTSVYGACNDAGVDVTNPLTA